MKLFYSFTRQAFYNTSIYRFDFWLQLFTVFLMMYSVFWLWKTLYTQQPEAFGVNLSQMITYAVLGMILDIIFFSGRGPQKYIATQIRTGAIDTDLMKPIDFHLYMFARNWGETLFRFLFLVVPAFLVGYLFLDVKLPTHVFDWILFAFSLLMGYFVFFSLNFLIAMLAIVTIDIRSIEWAYYALMRFFGGQVVPIWLFSGFLKDMAEILPFKCIYYIPMSIYIGKWYRIQALEHILFQLLWLVVLVIMGRLAWRYVHSRLVVQGG